MYCLLNLRKQARLESNYPIFPGGIVSVPKCIVRRAPVKKPVTCTLPVTFTMRLYSAHYRKRLSRYTTASFRNVERGSRDSSCECRGANCRSVWPRADLVDPPTCVQTTDAGNHAGIDDAALTLRYQDSDIISFPSTSEGFGMPLLEGQVVGRPVLTSDLEPMRGVAAEGGALLVNPKSVDARRTGFLALMRAGALRSRLIAAGKKNCSRFALESVAASYRALSRTEFFDRVNPAHRKAAAQKDPAQKNVGDFHGFAPAPQTNRE